MNKIKNIYNQIKFYFKKYGFWATVKKCLKKIITKDPVRDSERANYQEWIRQNEPNEEELKAQRNHKFKIEPKISIVVPMYNTKEEFFKDLVNCLKNQTYSNWELCLADGSPKTNENLKKYYEDDERIKYKLLESNEGISGNTNEALKMVTGDYIGLLDHDDAIPIFALYEIVKCINENPEVEFIYTDEDKIENTLENRCDPHFKPDFAPDTLSANNYITHFVIMKKELMVDKIGGFRDEYNGAQDFDLVLRASELTKNIVHISKVLYHWRVHNESTAKVADAKPYAYEAGKRAAQDHITRMGRKGTADFGNDIPGVYEIEYDVIGNPKVNILIPNKDGIKFLKKCVNSILEKTTYKNYEIDIIENNSEEKETFEYYEELKKNDKIKILTYPEKGFNYSKIINYGVKNVDGEFVMQLNNDTELLTPNWLELMVGFAQRKDVGGVGVKMYYPDETIQHAGVIVGLGGVAGHRFKNLPKDGHAYFAKESMIEDLSAVTAACIMNSRKVYEDVDFMDEKFAVAFNDVDFCLKIREKGYLIVYNPYIEFIHYESKSRGYENTPEKIKRFQGEIKRFRDKWGDFVENGDPYYNKNLEDGSEQYPIKHCKVN